MLLQPSRSQLKCWSKLRMAKYRLQEGTFLAEGIKVVQELLKSPWETAAVLVMAGRESRWESILDSLSDPLDIYLLTEDQWHGISQDKEPEGMMAQVITGDRFSTDPLPAHLPGHILLGYQISNPGNLGALLRTAHWFGLENVFLSRHSVDVTHPKVIRAAMGSLFHLRMAVEMDFTTLLPKLKETHAVVGTDVALGIPPHEATAKTALLVGNESHGLPADLKALVDECWTIPGAGGAESLSLPQATAIMMYALTRQEMRSI